MRWAVILWLIVGVGAGADASARQVKDTSADLSRRSVGAEAEAKAAFERGRAAATEYRAALDLYPRHEPAAAALKRIQPR